MLILSNKDLLDAGCFDITSSLKIVEETLQDYSDNKVLYPDKVSQIFDQETQNRINCLPATLLNKKVSGMKWVAVFPENPKAYHLPNLNATILLSEIEKGFPIAFMDGTLCSNLRTASVSAVAAKFLAKKNPETIGFIGSGEQAKMHFLALKHQMPTIKVCKVASRHSVSELNFISSISSFYPDVEFIPCNSDYERAAMSSDIVVTAISAQKPILQSEWLSDGALYLHVGGWEDDYSVPLSCDKIVCDDWNAVKHRTQTISRLYKMGKLHDEDIYGDLHEIVSGKKLGRTSDSEKIYFNAVGLSYVDVALAYSFYVKCKQIKTFDLDLLQHSVFEEQHHNFSI